MLEVDDLNGRSVYELAANSWKLITYYENPLRSTEQSD